MLSLIIAGPIAKILDMKLYRLFFHRLLFLGIAFTLWGCLEYHITTQIMPDGRILRTVTVKGDSANIFKGSFLVPADSTWTISTHLESRSEKDVQEVKVYVYEARKEFKDFHELNREFFHDSVFADHIAIRVSLEKKFNWFYYHYLYTETYGRLFPFRSEPISNYLNDSELRIHLADEKDIYYSPELDSILFIEDSLNLPVLGKTDSLRYKALRDTIEQKFESWQKINIYNDFYHVLTAALKNLGHTSDTVAERSLFYHWLDQEKTFETGIENDDAFLNAASEYFKVRPLKLHAANPTGFESFNKKFRIAAYSLETYTSRVLMPGMIIHTNAGKTDVNVASWTFKIDNFYAADYIMVVESRMVNRWFVTGAGVVLFLLIALLLLRLFKK